MRALILSDTHHSLDRAYEVYEKLNSEKKIDAIVHCGDHLRDADELKRELGIPVIYCSGNCDSYDERYIPFNILETEYGNFLVTHGHEYGVDYSLDRLGYKAEELNCIGAIFGHTHRALYIEENGIIFMNPGSLTRPRDNSGGTYGIIETTEEGIFGMIYYYGSKQ